MLPCGISQSLLYRHHDAVVFHASLDAASMDVGNLQAKYNIGSLPSLDFGGI